MLESLTKRQLAIVSILSSIEESTITHLMEKLEGTFDKISQTTLSRDLNSLIVLKMVVRNGHGRATSYHLSPFGKVILPIDEAVYFQLEVDKRPSLLKFQQSIFDTLEKSMLFTNKEGARLQRLEKEHLKGSSNLSPTILKKEWERITIEFSWKSSSIEGNTYSLLETENLILEGVEAKGKSKEETTMILNHKKALAFIREEAALFQTLTIPLIEQVHSILVGELGITTNLRKTLVGITGTKYQPLDNEYQIREAIGAMCRLINHRQSPFEKSILAILLISYIQPFEDGNKRTSRLIGNAILLAWKKFPLSFRSVSNDEYKKAILLFYEQNNIYSFKQIFLKQAEFAVGHYFRSQGTLG